MTIKNLFKRSFCSSRVFHKMLYNAYSPQKKKEPQGRENKLKMFLKRSSEPLLNLQNSGQQGRPGVSLILLFILILPRSFQPGFVDLKARACGPISQSL